MRRLTGIRAVSFDVDGTLWDFVGAMRRSLGEVLVELRRLDAKAAAMLDVDRMIDITDRLHNELKGRITDLATIRREAFRQTLIDVGRPDDALALHLNEVYFRHRYGDIAPFEDVLPVLEALQPRYTLGVIANGNTYPEHLGLERFFKFAVHAQDCGIEKPDPRIFELALEKAGCSPQEMVHVGDSLEIDVAGAANAGIRSVWLNRCGEGARPDIKPDAEIASLRELLEIF